MNNTFYRPRSICRRNIQGVIYPLTAAIEQVFGSRRQDGARPIGAFYTVNISNDACCHVGGIWYAPIDEQVLLTRATQGKVVEAFVKSIRNGAEVLLPSLISVTWEPINQNLASQLPPALD